MIPQTPTYPCTSLLQPCREFVLAKVPVSQWVSAFQEAPVRLRATLKPHCAHQGKQGNPTLTIGVDISRENQLLSTKLQVQLKVGGEGKGQEEAEIVKPQMQQQSSLVVFSCSLPVRHLHGAVLSHIECLSPAPAFIKMPVGSPMPKSRCGCSSVSVFQAMDKSSLSKTSLNLYHYCWEVQCFSCTVKSTEIPPILSLHAGVSECSDSFLGVWSHGVWHSRGQSLCAD